MATQLNFELGVQAAGTSIRHLTVAVAAVRSSNAGEQRSRFFELVAPFVRSKCPKPNFSDFNSEEIERKIKELCEATWIISEFYLKDGRTDLDISTFIYDYVEKNVFEMFQILPNNYIKYNDLVAKNPELKVSLDNLSTDLAMLLSERLQKQGVSEAESDAIVSNVISQFQSVSALRSREQLAAAVDLAAEVLTASQSSASQILKDGNSSSRIPKWTDRNVDSTTSAVDFLQKYYGSRLGIDGDLTYAALGRIDTGLQTALVREFKGRRNELHDLLPTTKSRTDARLFREFGYVPEGADRTAKLAALSRRTAPSP